MRIPLLCAAIGALAIVACGKDSPTESSTGGGTTTPIVYTLTLDSGIVDSVPATVGTPVPVRVKLTKAGAAVPNSIVTWTLAAGNGTVSSATSTTGANGIASVTWTLADTSRINAMTITSQDASLQYHATGVAGPAATLVKVSPDSSTVVAGASVIITARVTDLKGNPSVGSSVNWTTTGGTLTTSTTTTASSGNAQTVLTTTARGRYTITATLPGKASVTFVLGVI